MKKIDKIKTILIGFGRIAYGYNIHNKKNILTHYKALKNDNRFSLLGIIENNNLKRKKYSKKLKLKSFKKLSEIRGKLFPKLAIISSDTKTHIKLIREILKKHPSIKIILCEKPMGSNFAKAQKVVKDCENSKVKLFINYIRISDPGVSKIKKIIKKEFRTKTKGTIFYDGSTLNQASHLINLTQFWFGKVLNSKRIFIDKTRKINSGKSFLLKFSNADIVFIALNIKNFTYASVELISPNGRIQYEERGEKISFQKSEKDRIFGEDFMPKRKKIYIKNDLANYQKNVLSQLYLSDKNQKYNLCSGAKALETLKVIDKLN